MIRFFSDFETGTTKIIPTMIVRIYVDDSKDNWMRCEIMLTFIGLGLYDKD